MPIDWFTVIAQAINFFVLLWLLKRFLYHPILDALDAREKKIAGVIANADKTKASAEQLKTQYEQKLADIEQQCHQLIANAEAQAQESAKSILDKAQSNADKLHHKRMEAIEIEIAHLQQDVLKSTLQEVYALCKKVLSDLADYDIQELMLNKLIQRINALDNAQTDALNNALDASNNSIVINSAFALSDAQVKRLIQCISDKSQNGNSQNITFTQRITPTLIAGVEITTSGWKMSWSIQHYLTVLQTKAENTMTVPSVDSNESFESQAESQAEGSR